MVVGDSLSTVMPISQASYVGSMVSNSSFIPTSVGSMDIVLLKPSFQSFPCSRDDVAVGGISLSYEDAITLMVFIIVAFSITDISGLLLKHTCGCLPLLRLFVSSKNLIRLESVDG